MAKAILLTGAPGCGKTTLIKQVVGRLSVPVCGFYTEEIRQGAQRQGFKLVTLDGQTDIMAHIDFNGPTRVGKYGLDIYLIEVTRVNRDHLMDEVRQRVENLVHSHSH
jgi:nucleoside-triphosphatase